MEHDFFWDQKATDSHVGATRRVKERGELMWAMKRFAMEPLCRVENERLSDKEFNQELEAAMRYEPSKIWVKQKDALHFAAALGKTDLCERLLDRGWSVDEADSQGRSPFEAACSYRQEETAVMLVERGANVDFKNKLGELALHLAARELMPKACAKLLESGASDTALNAGGETPALVAIWEMLRLSKPISDLVEMFGARLNPNAKDSLGNTALHMACSRVSGRKEPGWVAWLASQGADVNAQSKRGETALSLACARDRFTGYETAAQLLLLGADPNLGAGAEQGYAEAGWGNEKAANVLKAWREARALESEMKRPSKPRSQASL